MPFQMWIGFLRGFCATTWRNEWPHYGRIWWQFSQWNRPVHAISSTATAPTHDCTEPHGLSQSLTEPTRTTNCPTHHVQSDGKFTSSGTCSITCPTHESAHHVTKPTAISAVPDAAEADAVQAGGCSADASTATVYVTWSPSLWSNYIRRHAIWKYDTRLCRTAAVTKI